MKKRSRPKYEHLHHKVLGIIIEHRRTDKIAEGEYWGGVILDVGESHFHKGFHFSDRREMWESL